MVGTNPFAMDGPDVSSGSISRSSSDINSDLLSSPLGGLFSSKPVASAPAGPHIHAAKAAAGMPAAEKSETKAVDADNATIWSCACLSTDEETLLLEGHGLASSLSFYELWRTQQLCDVTLVAGGGLEIKASRFILAACSPFFKALFTSDSAKDARQSRIDLNDLDIRVLRMVVEAVHSRSITVSMASAAAAFACADRLQISSVREACAQYLSANASFETAPLFFSLGRAFNVSDFKEKAADLLRANLFTANRAKCCPHFHSWLLKRPFKTILELLELDGLVVGNEETVLEVVLSWVRYDAASRRAHMSALLSSVRLVDFSPARLMEIVRQESLINENNSCLRMVLDALMFREHGYDAPPPMTPSAARREDRLHVDETVSFADFSLMGSEPVTRLLARGRWVLTIYPRGDPARSADGNLSAYISNTEELTGRPRVHRFRLTVLSQAGPGHAIHHEGEGAFSASSSGFGYPCFARLLDLYQAKRRYLENDVLTMRVEIWGSGGV